MCIFSKNVISNVPRGYNIQVRITWNKNRVTDGMLINVTTASGNFMTQNYSITERTHKHASCACTHIFSFFVNLLIISMFVCTALYFIQSIQDVLPQFNY